MAIDLKKIFPIQDIEGGYLIAGNGDITAGWEIRLPEVFTLSVDRYNQLHHQLVSALVKLPAGTVIQMLNYYYLSECGRPSRSSNYCTAENEKALIGRPVLHHTCRLFITFSSGTLGKITAENNPVVKLWDYLTRKPFKDVESAIRQALGHTKGLNAALEGVGQAGFERMDDQALRQCLWEFWNMSFDRPGHSQPGKLPPYRVEQGYLRIGGSSSTLVTTAYALSNFDCGRTSVMLAVPVRRDCGYPSQPYRRLRIASVNCK